MYIPLLRSLPNANAAFSTASASSQQAASSSPSPSDLSGGLDTMFLQLLSAQLKAQSPTNPLDPNQFVAQLAQFQSLSELTQIDELMQTLVGNTTSASGSSGKAHPVATSSSPVSSAILNSISH